MSISPYCQPGGRALKHKKPLFAIAAILLIEAVATLYYQHQAEQQHQVNDYLITEVKKVEKDLKEIQALRQLRQTRLHAAAVMTQLAKLKQQRATRYNLIVTSLPSEWSLTQLTSTTSGMTIKGEGNVQPHYSPWRQRVLSHPAVQAVRLADHATTNFQINIRFMGNSP